MHKGRAVSPALHLYVPKRNKTPPSSFLSCQILNFNPLTWPTKLTKTTRCLDTIYTISGQKSMFYAYVALFLSSISPINLWRIRRISEV